MDEDLVVVNKPASIPVSSTYTFTDMALPFLQCQLSSLAFSLIYINPLTNSDVSLIYTASL